MENWEKRLREHGRQPTDAEIEAEVIERGRRKSNGLLRILREYTECVAPMFLELEGVWGESTIPISNHDSSALWHTDRHIRYQGQGSYETKMCSQLIQAEYGICQFNLVGQNPLLQAKEVKSHALVISGSQTSNDDYLRSSFSTLRILGNFKTSDDLRHSITDVTINTSGRRVDLYHKDQIQHIFDLDTQKRKQLGLI